MTHIQIDRATARVPSPHPRHPRPYGLRGTSRYLKDIGCGKIVPGRYANLPTVGLLYTRPQLCESIVCTYALHACHVTTLYPVTCCISAIC